MSLKDGYFHRTPLTEAIRGTKPKTADDFTGETAKKAMQDMHPHAIPEPSRERRLRGSSPVGGK